MKLKKYTALALGILLGASSLTSCDDWFDVIPRSSVYDEDLYKNETGYQQVLTGLYLGMSNNALYGREASFGLMDVLAGTYFIPKTPNEAYRYAMQFNYENARTKGMVTSIWENAYNQIANANELLRKAGVQQDVEPDATKQLTPSDAFNSEQTRNIIVGEALAVRAFLHLDMVRMFGSNTDGNKPAIPYVTVLKKDITPQSTVNQALEKVTTDLLQAESLLRGSDPIVKGNPLPDDEYFLRVTRPTHFNYYAVCALLARVYQLRKMHDEAATWAQKVIDSGAFRWTKTAELNKGDYVGKNELVASLFLKDMKDRVTPVFKSTGDGENSSLLPISMDKFQSLFASNDKRGKGFQQYSGQYLAQKYVVTEDVADTLSTRKFIPLIRLSEMYYIVTESQLEAGADDKASETLNKVRMARGLKSQTFDRNALWDELNDEYQREFVAEGQLFFYIKRRNLPGLIQTQFNIDFVFPLPENEYTYGNRQSNK